MLSNFSETVIIDLFINIVLIIIIEFENEKLNKGFLLSKFLFFNLTKKKKK